MTSYIMMSFYFCLLLLVMHNTWRYLIKKKKYRIYLFSSFYFLVYLLVLSRFYYYIYSTLYLHGNTNCKDIQAEESKIVSDYTRITLGCF